MVVVELIRPTETLNTALLIPSIMKFTTSLLLATLAVATPAALLRAQAVPSTISQAAGSEQTVEPIFWPKEGRPKLNVSSFYTDFDGIDVPMIQLQVDSLNVLLSNRKTLRARGSNSYRYSGELTDSRLPGVSLGLSVFKADEFLPDLSDQSWNAYKAGLAAELPNAEIVLDNSNIGQAITPYVFGEQFRQIVYEQATPQAIVKRREIFAFVNSRLLVFTVSGTKAAVDQNWTSIEHLISEMSRS